VPHAQYEAQQQHSPLSRFYTLSLDFWDYARDEMRKSGFTVVDLRPVLNDAFLDGGPCPYTVSGHLIGASYHGQEERLLSTKSFSRDERYMGLYSERL
jgi:hypothetical protein